MRPAFDKLGVGLVVVSAQAAGAQEFMDTVWRGGDLYVDPEQTFKKALGAVKTKNWWILKPSVLKQVFGLSKKYGHAENDINKLSEMQGGMFVIKSGDQGVHWKGQENSEFGLPAAEAVFEAAQGAIA